MPWPSSDTDASSVAPAPARASAGRRTRDRSPGRRRRARRGRAPRAASRRARTARRTALRSTRPARTAAAIATESRNVAAVAAWTSRPREQEVPHRVEDAPTKRESQGRERQARVAAATWASSTTSQASVAATWRSISAPPTRSSTCAAAGSCSASRRWSRSTSRRRGVRRRARGQADARPHARDDQRDPPAEGRRDRRLRRDRADAAALHPEGAPASLRAPARRRLRALGRDRRREARRRGGDALGRRAPGVPDRGADGGCDRRRPAGGASRPGT